MGKRIENDSIMVSICCATYNHEKFIRQCLDGFIMQKVNFPIEVLIHDDASTDNTQTIIREYEHKYPDLIKPIYQKENQYSKGVKVSVTYLYSRAKGKYVALCEGDDYWTDPYKLQKQVDFLESHSDYSMCFHNAMHHFENGEQLDSGFVSENVKERDYTGSEILEQWIVPTASVVFKSEILFSNFYQKLSNDPRIVYGDTPLFLTASHFGKLRYFNDCMSVYRAHNGGLTMNCNFETCKKLPDHYKVLSDFFSNEISCIRAKISQSYMRIAIESLKHRHFGLFLASFMKAVFYSPYTVYKVLCEIKNI